jgi:hypothetical protein
MKWLMDSDSDSESLDTDAKPSKVTVKPSTTSPSDIIDLDDDEDSDDVHLVGEALIAVEPPAPEFSTAILLSSSPAPLRPPPRVAKSNLDDSNLSISQPVMRRLKRKLDVDDAENDASASASLQTTCYGDIASRVTGCLKKKEIQDQFTPF